MTPDPLSPSENPAIEVEALEKRYGGVAAVRAISFRLARGEVLGLLGGNGAGKTTTIGMIMGLVLPSGGRVSVFGTDMAKDRYRVLHRMNFESPYVDMPHRLTVRQNLEVFGRLYGVDRIKARITDLARELHLEAFLDRESGALSAGQKTRVALAKSLINEPDLLLLDEPTASLDPDTADWVRTRLETYRRDHNASILLASHNMAEVERLCDRVIIMKAGQIADEGTPQNLILKYGRQSLEEVFLDVARAPLTEGAAA